MPEDDALDGRAYYAAKSACDTEKRYLFGWLPTKYNDSDGDNWMWGGNLVVHEIYPREDGTLASRMPDSVKSAWTPIETHEEVNVENDDILIFSETGDTCRFDAVLEYEKGTCSFGIEIGYDHREKKGYKFEFFPEEKLVNWDSVSDEINAAGVMRPFTTKACQPIRISLVMDGEMSVLYINDEYALSTRMYNMAGRDISFFVKGGSASLRSAEFFTLKK